MLKLRKINDYKTRQLQNMSVKQKTGQARVKTKVF